MEKLEDILLMPLSLYKMGDIVDRISSPRRQLFQLIVKVSGLTPNTVKMILCATSAGMNPREEICKKIARQLGRNADTLFPEVRGQPGSLVYLYQHLPGYKVEKKTLIDLLSQATGVKAKTVKEWLKNRRVPSYLARYRIAEAIGVSIVQLFPLEEGATKHYYERHSPP